MSKGRERRLEEGDGDTAAADNLARRSPGGREEKEGEKECRLLDGWGGLAVQVGFGVHGVGDSTEIASSGVSLASTGFTIDGFTREISGCDGEKLNS